MVDEVLLSENKSFSSEARMWFVYGESEDYVITEMICYKLSDESWNEHFSDCIMQGEERFNDLVKNYALLNLSWRIL